MGTESADVGFDSRVVDFMARLNRISSSLNQVWDRPAALEPTLNLIVDSAALAVPGASAAAFAFDAQTVTLTPLPEGASSATVPHPPALAMQAVADQRPVLSYEDPATGSDQAHAVRQSIACLPMFAGKSSVGVLYVSLQASRSFSRLEIQMLESLAIQAATAIYQAGQRGRVQRDLARKEDELVRLRRAGLLISSRMRLDDTLDAILQMALEVTEAKYGIFRLVDKEGQNLIMRAIAGEHLGRPAVEALPVNATSIMGLVAKRRQPVCITDVREDPWVRVYYPLDHSLEMRSELAVPLVGSSGRLEGVLNLESPTVGAFDEGDSHLLQALATQAVIAIQEVRLLDALQEMAERLLTQPLPEVLDHLAALACELLNTGASAVWILNDERLVLSAASSGNQRGDILPLQGSLTGQAILTRAPVTSDDVRRDERFAWPDLARAQGWKRALIVPILASDGEAVGAFSVYATDAEAGQSAATEWEKKVLTILAHYAALAVRHAADQAALHSAEEQRVAAETFAAVGDITANLVHQLNNKIGTIPVRVEGIQDKSAAAVASDPYLAANLDEIDHSARDAMQAVRQSVAHMQMTRLGPVDVAECANEALSRLHLPAAVQVRVTLAGLPPVMAGQQGLTLVFANLLDNARDAMGGAGRIEIGGRASREWVEVDLRDSGPGIPADLHDRIFELSFSGRRSGRLGFGLWWVKTWMNRLGGAISVESDGRHGTCFRLRLPRSESAP